MADVEGPLELAAVPRAAASPAGGASFDALTDNRPMLIRIERERHLPEATLGVLLIDGQPYFATREDPVRGDQVFVPGESALPPGLYNLTFSYSRRFGLELPLIVSTQPVVERRRSNERLGMRFHPGEPEIDLGGEILLGKARDGLTVCLTGVAFREFSAIIRAAMDRGEAIEVEIN
jgi:hypothetical protein